MKTPDVARIRICVITVAVLVTAGGICPAGEIHLKDGSVIKGTVMELKRGETYRIEERDGSEHIYRMADIKSVKIGAADRRATDDDPAEAYLSVTVVPPNAEIFLDGTRIEAGTHPVAPYVAHRVRAERRGYATETVDTAARPGRTRSLRIEMDTRQFVYIGPRVGISMTTGVIGLEAQVGHLALDIGWFPDTHGEDAGFIFGAIKYYMDPSRSSLYLAAAGGAGEPADGDEKWAMGGVMTGYRWRWGDAWDLSVGMGLGANRIDEDLPAPRGNEVHVLLIPMGELAAGHSF